MAYSQWWANQRFAPEHESLSILDLVNSGTVDCKLAALLWLLVEQRASLLVAAGPSFAGKTTLFHALMDFLPPELEQIALQGYYEDFKFLEYSQPDKSYLMTEELSDHSYEYLWGFKAIRAFMLMTKGYALGGTIHARTAEEAIYVLHRALGLPLPMLSRLDVIVILKARAGREYNDEPIRRVNSVNLILPAKEGLAIQVLAAQQYSETGFDYQTDSALQASLAAKFLIGTCRVNAEIETRERLLRHLRKKGQISRQEVRKAVLNYYSSRTK
jgi:hypothetical protein